MAADPPPTARPAADSQAAARPAASADSHLVDDPAASAEPPARPTADSPAAAPSPQLRADAARNRETLLAAATRAFATAEAEPSMREIARLAGVGAGTLYRHFPTREALVDAVYRDQVVRLTAGARDLLAEHSPAEALRRWMDLFGDWLATKHGMVNTVLAMIDAGEISLAHTRQELLSAIAAILEAGAAAGDIRPDADAADIAAALIGIFTVAGKTQRHAQAARLLDLLMDGLRYQPAAPSAR